MWFIKSWFLGDPVEDFRKPREKRMEFESTELIQSAQLSFLSLWRVALGCQMQMIMPNALGCPCFSLSASLDFSGLVCRQFGGWPPMSLSQEPGLQIPNPEKKRSTPRVNRSVAANHDAVDVFRGLRSFQESSSQRPAHFAAIGRE